MALKFKVSGGGGDFKTLPAGSHIAICNMVVDLGLQPGSGMYPDPKQKIYVRFEVPTERVEYERDGKKYDGPGVIGNFFTASMHEKANLRKQLEGWRGRKFSDEEAENFDVSSILGKACMLSVVENVKGDKVYANIASIGALPKGIPTPKPENDLLYFAADDRQHLDKLPEWIREKIAGQIKPQSSHATGVYAATANYHDSDPGITDDDIPF